MQALFFLQKSDLAVSYQPSPAEIVKGEKETLVILPGFELSVNSLFIFCEIKINI